MNKRLIQQLGRRINRKYLLNLLTIIIVLVSIYYLVSNRSDFIILKNLGFIQIFILLSLNFLLLVLNALFSWYQFKQFNLKLGVVETFFLTTATSFGNSFLPFRSGMGIQAVYLKKLYKFRYSQFASVLTGAYIINFLIVGLSGIFAVIFIYFTRGIFNVWVFFAFLSLVIGVLFALRFSKIFLKLILFQRLREIAESILDGWDKISNSSKKIFILSIIFFANIITLSTLMFFQFQFLNITKDNGEYVTILDGVFLSSFLVLASILNITPSALGIKEVFLAYAAMVVTINPQAAIVTSVLDRIVGVSVQMIFGPIALYYLKNKGQKHVIIHPN